jgi:hypothetical protein
VDSAQSFDIMTVLRPVVWTQGSHYDKIYLTHVAVLQFSHVLFSFVKPSCDIQ